LESKITTLNQSHEIEQTQEVIDEVGAIEIKDDIEGATEGAVVKDEISQEEKNKQRLKDLAKKKKLEETHKWLMESEVNTT